MPGKAWKLAKGRFGFVTSRGKRGIKKSLSAARSAAGLVSGSSKSRSKSKKSRRKSSNKKKGGRRMARNMTLPLGTLSGVAAGFIITQNSKSPLHNALDGDYENAVRRYIENMSGLDVKTGKWDPLKAKGTLALLIGVGLSKYVGGKMGVNSRLGRAGVPLIRI